MKSYRLYLLNQEDRVTDALEVLFENDDEALAKARKAGQQHYAVEVWNGGRLVGRLGEEFQLRRF
jgi:hypothetical protein